jgi:hypothetical protein
MAQLVATLGTLPGLRQRGYHDRATARAVRRQQIQAFGEKTSDLNVYKCRHGSGLFHLGHPPETRREEAS